MWTTTALLLGVALLALHLRWRSKYRSARAEIDGLNRLQALLRDEYRRESEQEKARQQTIFDGMMEGVAVLEPSGRFQTANLAFRRFLNVTTDIRGKSAEDCALHPQVGELIRRLKDEGQIVGVEITLEGPPPRILQANGNRLSGDQGRLLVMHDVTRIKELERNRKEFVANVSHELRTPLSLIKGYVETLLNGAIEDKTSALKFLHTINKHSDRLTYLIEDLLTLSRLEGGQVSMNCQPTLLAELVDQIVDDLSTRATERSIIVTNQIDPTIEVIADGERLKQVFFNLLENAIKYGRSPGHVEIGARRLPAGGVEAWVQDDGPGIPAESRDRVFERFYRVDRARARDTGGTGLGLAIVKHIIKAHGGEVWVNSELDRGSTFHVTLPGEV